MGGFLLGLDPLRFFNHMLDIKLFLFEYFVEQQPFLSYHKIKNTSDALHISSSLHEALATSLEVELCHASPARTAALSSASSKRLRMAWGFP